MTSRSKSQWIGTLFWLAFILVIVSMTAVRWQIIPVSVGVITVGISAIIMLLYALISFLALCLYGVRRKPVPGHHWLYFLVGVLPLAALFFSVGLEGFKAPGIHDITTDTVNPPAFVFAVEDREAGDHDVSYQGSVIAGIQTKAYPDLRSVEMALPPAVIYGNVLEVIDDFGWRLLGTDDKRWTAEAVFESRLFGFEDDIVVRVQAKGQGSIVDVRSASRVGGGDLGANAQRIKRFMAALKEKK